MNNFESIGLKCPNFNNLNFKGLNMYNTNRITDFSIEEVQPRVSDNNTISSEFKFIEAHKGLHKGHVHLLVGRTNKGKSALILEIILENAINGRTCLLFLSEALKEDIRTQIDMLLRLKKISIEKHIHIRKHINLITEDDFTGNCHDDPEKWINALSRITEEVGAELVFVDNISGIKFGNATPSEQSHFIKYLNKSTQRLNVVMFLAAHQSKNVDEDCELTINSVRANQNFTSIPTIVYALNDFCNLDKSKRVVKILKSRIHGDAIGKYYDLTYRIVKKEGHYTKDKEISNTFAKSLFVSNKKLNKTNFSKS